MLFLFVHCFVINLVNGLRSFLRKALGLFYVKIHVQYILTHKLIRIKVDPLLGRQKMSTIWHLHISRRWGRTSVSRLLAVTFVQDAGRWQSFWWRAGNAEMPPRPPVIMRWRPVGGWSPGNGGEPTPPVKSVVPCWSASARQPQTRCHPPSPSSTRISSVLSAIYSPLAPEVEVIKTLI